MPVLSRKADAFQRALQGAPGTDSELAPLLHTVGQVRSLGYAPAPDQVFVDALRDRLMAEARSMPAPTRAAARARAAGRADARPTPVVVVVGRGLPRALAGAAASVLLVGGIIGAVSRQTLPGDSLYPVKTWLDNVAVQLAGSDFDRGQTFLAQGQEHISDARDLTDAQSAPSVGDVNTALRQAIDSVRSGQRALDASYASTGSPQALIAIRDFAARATPQVEALRTQAPSGSLPLVGELEALLQDSQQATGRRLAACGPACGSAAGTSFSPATLPSTATTGQPSGASAGTGRTGGPVGVVVPSAPLGNRSTAGIGGVPAPGVTAPGVSAPGGSAPGVSIGTGGVGIGRSGTGATLSTSGAIITLPPVSVPAPVVTTTPIVPLPSISVTTSGVHISLPGATLGAATLPSVNIHLP